MKTYQVVFSGRKKGAIGYSCWHTVTVQGEDEAQALLNLYKEYDHISVPKFTELKKED